MEFYFFSAEFSTESNFIGLTFSCNHWKITYNTGMLKSPIMVPINNPNAAPVAIDRFPTYPIPDENTNGINPKMKAKEVIKIGRKRDFAPLNADLAMDSPCRLR